MALSGSPALFSQGSRIIDWDGIAIEEDYLIKLKSIINKNYPAKAQFDFEKPKYPAKDIKAAVFTFRDERDSLNKLYNPFGLKLVSQLHSASDLHASHCIRSDEEYFLVHKISELDAASAYLNFLKQYNLAYITFLEAINGSDVAAQLMKLLFSSDKMFKDANVNFEHLRENIKDRRPDFLLALLAHLTLGIVFSEDAKISTVARARALEFVRKNFNVDALAEALTFYGSEFCLKHTAVYGVKEAAYDLIPGTFARNPNEVGDTDQNKLFFENVVIKDIFQHIDRRNLQLDAGIARLVGEYRAEMLQVLHSLLRLLDTHFERKLYQQVFASIISLSELDRFQKAEIFGINASFRNRGASHKTMASRLGWSVGTKVFGGYLSEQELNKLSAEELKIRVRQNASRINQLQDELNESSLFKIYAFHKVHELDCSLRLLKKSCVDEIFALETEINKLALELVEAGKDAALKTINDRNDPDAYFKTLLLPTDTPEENFQYLLERHYCALIYKFYRDESADDHDDDKDTWHKLHTAYEFLADADKRKEYLSRPEPIRCKL